MNKPLTVNDFNRAPVNNPQQVKRNYAQLVSVDVAAADVGIYSQLEAGAKRRQLESSKVVTETTERVV
jgi:hypothetical protein